MNIFLSRLNQHRMLILLNALYAAAGLLWIILIPYNNAPDENTHFHYSVEFIIQNHRLPVWGVDDIERFRHALSSHNQMPALNYLVYAAGGTLANKLCGLELYLGARLVSLFWGLVFINFLFLAVRELCGSYRNSLIVAAGVAFIPQVFFTFCYINGDAHSLAIAAIFWFALARFFSRQSAGEAPRGKPRGIFAEPCEAKDTILSFHPVLHSRFGDGGSSFGATEDPPCGKPQGFPWPTRVVSGRLAKKGNIIFAGAAIGLLFSAKYNYYIYFPCIAVMLAWAVLRRLISWKTIGRLVIASAVLSLLISGFWFIRNYFLYGNPLPILMSEEFFRDIGLAREIHPVNHGLSLASLNWLVQQGFASSTFNSFFAVFGYLNVGFHHVAYIILQFIVPLIVLFFMLDLMTTRDRTARTVMAWLLLMIFTVMAMHVWACLTYDYQPQGRYQFTILVPIALYTGWVITRQASHRKYAVFFLIMMIWLFIGANILIVRTYAPPVQFSISEAGSDGHFSPSKRFLKKAERTEKNFYATEKIALTVTRAPIFLRIGLPDNFLGRYRDFKVELETDSGVITNDWSIAPPEELVNVTYNKQLNAFEVCGYDSSFILPLKNIAESIKSLKIRFRIENRRLYEPDW